MSSFSENLTYYRKLAGLNQNQLADKISVTPAQISRYERDMAEPRPDVLAKIAAVLKVKIEDLIPIPQIKETPFKKTGDVISKRMSLLNIGPSRLAGELGITTTTVELIAKGEVKGSPPVLKRILDYLRIPIDEIADSSEDTTELLSDTKNSVKLLIDLDSNGNCVTFSQMVTRDEESILIDGITELLKNYISQNNNNMPSISNIDEFELKGISVNFQKK